MFKLMQVSVCPGQVKLVGVENEVISAVVVKCWPCYGN